MVGPLFSRAHPVGSLDSSPLCPLTEVLRSTLFGAAARDSAGPPMSAHSLQSGVVGRYALDMPRSAVSHQYRFLMAFCTAASSSGWRTRSATSTQRQCTSRHTVLRAPAG